MHQHDMQTRGYWRDHQVMDYEIDPVVIPGACRPLTNRSHQQVLINYIPLDPGWPEPRTNDERNLLMTVAGPQPWEFALFLPS